MCNNLVNHFVMMRAMGVLVTCLGVACLPADSTPCAEGTHCDEGYYCNLDHYACYKCIRCEDLKRAALPAVVSCIKSIAECGPCLPGLVSDPSGNLDLPCVSAESVARPDLAYVWITLAVVALGVLLMGGILLYVLRNSDTFKMVSFTRASLQPGTCGRSTDPGSLPPPPPYNTAAYLPVRPTSPAPDLPVPPAPVHPTTLAYEDSSRPFIKRADSRRVRAPRERDSNQEAQVFNNPCYVRGPELPPSYDSTVSGGGGGVVSLHDEETVESMWTPSDDANNNFAQTSTGVPEPAGTAELSTLLSEARGTTLVRPPDRDRGELDDATPNKVARVRQDTNNNLRSRLEAGEGSANGGAPSAASPAPTLLPPSVNFNITVQQHNDVKLISA